MGVSTVERVDLSRATVGTISKTVKIVLFSSLANSTEFWGIFKPISPKLPPTGVLSMASTLKANGYTNVEFIDIDCEKRSFDEILEDLSDDPPGLIGVSVYTNMHEPTRERIAEFKQLLPDTPIVAGGPHAILEGLRIMQETEADFVCTGEGEFFIIELLEALSGQREFSTIKGLIYRNHSNEIIENDPRDLQVDLDTFPKPDYDLTKRYLSEYGPVPIFFKKGPILTLITSRGCPFQCKFCAKTQASKWRYHSSEYLVDMIEEQVKRYGFKEMIIFDSTFNISRERVDSFCDELIKRKIKLKWSASIVLHNITKEMAEKMSKAGCWLVHTGIESADDDQLKFISKGINSKKMAEKKRKLKEAGIGARGYFILGLPRDTEATIEKTIKFALDNPFYAAQFSIYNSYIGTPFSNTGEDLMYGEFFADNGVGNQLSLNEEEINFLSKGLTRKYLVAKQKEAIKLFYFRPKVILNILLKSFSFSKTLHYARNVVMEIPTLLGSRAGKRRKPYTLKEKPISTTSLLSDPWI